MTTTVNALPGGAIDATPTVRVGSGTVAIHLGGEATNGAYAFFEEVVDPAGSVPVHIHEWEDEAFFVLDGHFEFQVGDRTIMAGPGDFLIAPRGVPHTYRNLGDTPARKLALAWPAGLDRFFLEVGQPVAAPAGAPPPPSEHMAIPGLAETAARYGMTLVPSAVPAPANTPPD